MARIRYLKPDFTMDEDIAEVSIHARFLYQNLWCHMDRSGVCEASSRIIKAQIFPYDDEVTSKKVETYLKELIDHGFLFPVIYKGKAYLYCPTLVKHQKIHPKEQSKHGIPADHLLAATQPEKNPASNLLATSQPEIFPANLPLIGNGELELELELRTSETTQPGKKAFEVAWSNYPRKVEKSGAHKRFVQVIKSQGEFVEFEEAVRNYAAYCEDHRMPEPGIKHMSTFLENRDSKPYFQPWRDWIKKPESQKSTVPKTILPTGPITSTESERTRRQLDEIEHIPPPDPEAVRRLIHSVTKGV